MGFEPGITTRGGTAANGKPSDTVAQAAIQLDRADASWSETNGTAATVTYAYRATGTPPGTDGGTFSRFTAQQIVIADKMIAAWSDVADIHFVRVGSGTGTDAAYSDDATILLGDYHGGDANAAGYTYFPGSTAAASIDGDVWIDGDLSYENAPTLQNYGSHTLLHELGHAIGLSHPSDYDAGDATAPTYAASASYYQDSAQYSVMSYFDETETGADYSGSYAAEPMLDDIAAAQQLYGANETTRTGDTVYGFHSTAGQPQFDATAGPLVFAAWDAGGTDTFDFSGFAQAQKIDLRQGQFSNVGGLTDNVAIAIGVTIENAIGGSGADIVIGNVANNVLQGGAGNDHLYGVSGTDTLLGGDGDDTIDGSTGNDTVDGGAGTDTLLLAGKPVDYLATQNGDGSWTVAHLYGGTDHVGNIETVIVGGVSMAWSAFTAAAFDGLRYIASYPDLILAFGANAAAGQRHYLQYGINEGRTLTFDPVEYAASNLDVYRAYGLDYQKIAKHYILDGYYEHRQVASFDGLEYLASNPDLVAPLGIDADKAALHYLTSGIAEHRPTNSFDPMRYLLANPGLYATLGTNAHALTLDYLEDGIAQHRMTTSTFDPLLYAASYRDLAVAFGANAQALTQHWLQYGGHEGRSIDTFDPWGYAVANPDLYSAFGVNVDALALHYIQYGYDEHRALSPFDPALYAATNLDIARAFGGNLASITQHYLQYGIAEHRVVAGFDTLEYAASNPGLIATVGLDAHALALHYISIGLAAGLATNGFDRVAYMLSYGDAAGSGAQAALLEYLHGGYLDHASANGQFGDEQASHALGGGSIAASFETIGDRDWYDLTLGAAQTETITLAGIADPSLDTYLRLYDANGDLVAYNDDVDHDAGVYSSQVSATLSAGSYYIVAGTYDDEGSGSYQLSVAPVPASGAASAVAAAAAAAAASNALPTSAAADRFPLPAAAATAAIADHAAHAPLAHPFGLDIVHHYGDHLLA